MRNVIALFYFVGSENPCIYSVPNRKQSYESDVLLKVFAHIDKDVLTALLLSGMDSGKMIAKAFGDLAANSEKIGNLNITPDLLDTLVKRDGEL